MSKQLEEVNNPKPMQVSRGKLIMLNFDELINGIF